MKKLYEVQISTVAYVLAESEREAERMEHEIVRTEPLTCEARPVPKSATLSWPGSCLVYGSEKDMTLAEAVAKYVEDP